MSTKQILVLTECDFQKDTHGKSKFVKDSRFSHPAGSCPVIVFNQTVAQELKSTQRKRTAGVISMESTYLTRLC